MKKNIIIRNIAWLGLVLLAAGYLRYSIEETMTGFSEGLLIAGAVLLAGGIVANLGSLRTYSRQRSARLGLNTATITLAFLVILALVNYLGYRHHKRTDLTSEQLYSLSDETRKIVSGLQKDVKVIKFDKSDDQKLRDLMDEYTQLSKRITYDRIDPQAKPEVAKQYNVTRMGETVVSSGSRSEHPTEDNEQQLTNSIVKVTRDQLKTICFVEGHNEKQITSSDAEGYSAVDQALKDENYQTKTVNLVASNGVPSDCAVLIDAGPKQGLFPQEVEMVGKYIDGGGKAMLLLDPEMDPKVNDLLKKWNIDLGNDVVVDASGVGRLFGTGPAVPLVRTYGTHPITKDLANTMTFFPLARSVSSPSSSTGDVSDTELLKTSENSWAESDLKESPVKFDEGKDKKGPVSLGVAASRKVADKDARLVVIGDSDFASNNYVQMQSNGDLFLNAVNWLAEDEDLISIRPKSPTERSVTMTQSQQNTLFWLAILLIPGAIFGFGIYTWWQHR